MDIKKDTVVSQLVGKFTQYEAFHAIDVISQKGITLRCLNLSLMPFRP